MAFANIQKKFGKSRNSVAILYPKFGCESCGVKNWIISIPILDSKQGLCHSNESNFGLCQRAAFPPWSRDVSEPAPDPITSIKLNLNSKKCDRNTPRGQPGLSLSHQDITLANEWIQRSCLRVALNPEFWCFALLFKFIRFSFLKSILQRLQIFFKKISFDPLIIWKVTIFPYFLQYFSNFYFKFKTRNLTNLSLNFCFSSNFLFCTLTHRKFV